MTTQYVEKSQKCNECGGLGIVQEPHWAKFYHEDPNVDNYQKWFEDHGFRPDNIPPEEIECPTCGGRGEVTEDVDATRMLTTSQTAQTLHVSRSRVLALIRSGRLAAVRFGRQWAIEEAVLAEYKPRPRGRPRRGVVLHRDRDTNNNSVATCAT